MAIDVFLKIDDIKGESRDDKHKDEIDVLSWSWGLTNPGSAALGRGGGGGGGKASFQDISITKLVDKASADLMLHCANGKHIDEATLIVRKSGERPLEYIFVKMNDVMVTSVLQEGEAGDVEPSESVTFNYAEVEFKYVPQTDKGDQLEPKIFGWNVAKNKSP